MRGLYVAIILLLATATLVFALQNLAMVSVDLLWISMNAPLTFVVAATYVAGMVTGNSFLALCADRFPVRVSAQPGFAASFDHAVTG